MLLQNSRTCLVTIDIRYLNKKFKKQETDFSQTWKFDRFVYNNFYALKYVGAVLLTTSVGI